MRIRILIADKKFQEAGTSIGNHQSEIGNPWALWLFLAESSSVEQALNAYKNYFAVTKAPTDQAAFNYGSLLEERGDDAAAMSRTLNRVRATITKETKNV